MKTARFGCRTWRSRLFAHLDGALDPTEQELVERHLEDCAACRSAIDFEHLVEEALHRDAGIDFDPDFEDRIAQGVARGIETPPARTFQAPARWKMVAAILVCAGVGALLARHFSVESRDSDPQQQIARPENTTPAPGNSEIRPETPSVAEAAPPEHDADKLPSISPEESRRLSVARSTVREALVKAAASEDFAAEFARATDDLARERWPLDALVRGAIEDPDPEVARAAIAAIHPLSIRDATPALRRSVRRQEVAGSVYLALGDLKDTSSLPAFERALRDPALVEFACRGLSRMGSERAAELIARKLDDPSSFASAVDALVTMGEPGIAWLLVRAERGNIAIRDSLRSRSLPTDRQLENLLTSHSDPAVLDAAARFAATRGTGAIGGVLALLASNDHQALAIDALITIGGRPALAGLLAAADRGVLDSAGAGIAALRILTGTLDRGSLVRESATGARGSVFVRSLTSALTAGCSEELTDLGVAALGEIVANESVALQNRLWAARRLAESERFESTHALALIGAAWIAKDADAVVTSIITAARGGVELERRDLPDPNAPEIESILERASRLGDRWRTRGSEPTAEDRSILVQKFQRALP